MAESNYRCDGGGGRDLWPRYALQRAPSAIRPSG